MARADSAPLQTEGNTLLPKRSAGDTECVAALDVVRRSRGPYEGVDLVPVTGSGSVLVIYPPTFEPSWIVHDAPLLATY